MALRGFCISPPFAIESAAVAGAAFSRRPENAEGKYTKKSGERAEIHIHEVANWLNLDH